MGALDEPPRTSILEELLFALMGYSGDVFVDDGANTPGEANTCDPSHCSFHLATDIDFMLPADREVLNELVELGYSVRSLEAFVQQEQHSWSRPGGSQYRCALANGIQELLGVYRGAILQVQQHMRGTATPSLATLNYFLTEFKVLLPAVHHIVYEVHTRQLRGNQLLLLLHLKANCGILEVQSCLGRLQWHCHQVLYKQLTAWMVHGLLIDQCEEFFIQRGTMPDQQPVSSSPSQEDMRMDLLPPEVSGETPSSILFIGKAVRMLRPPHGSVVHDQLGAAAALKRLRQAPAFDATQFELVVEGIREQAAERLWQLVLVQGELPLHLKALQDYFLMGRGDFYQTFLLESHSLMGLPPVHPIAEININVPFQQAARKSSAESDPLFAHLRVRCPPDPDQDHRPSGMHTGVSSATPRVPTALPSTYRTGFAMPTVTPATSFPGLALPSTAYVNTAITTHGSAARASADGTPYATPATGQAKVRGKRAVTVPAYDPGWDMLSLEYQVNWPLQLLLSPEVMVRYSRLFQYLFRLKRLQLELERCWATINRRGSRCTTPLAAPHGMPPLWQVRSHMAYFISNLQLYIQVDVIGVQSSKLMAAIKGVRDLKAAARAHEDFLAACVVQSCLDVATFTECLCKILKTCKAFCDHLQKDNLAWEDELMGYPRKLVDDFQRNSRVIYKMLSAPAMQSRARAPYLRQLLLRLNFNNYMQDDTDRHAPANLAPRSQAAGTTV